jgi:catechol 2,3-dioxygenase-like lactoylglutathione lyase family enzyme
VTVTPYHTGIVVDDLVAAMRMMRDVLGVEWLVPRRVRTPLRGPNGITPRETWMTYSVGGQQQYELIEEVAGGLFVPADGSPRLHHVAYWVDDLPAASAHLDATGCPLYLTAALDGPVAGMAYHRGAGRGLYIELLDAARKPQHDAVLRGPRWHPSG